MQPPASSTTKSPLVWLAGGLGCAAAAAAAGLLVSVEAGVALGLLGAASLGAAAALAWASPAADLAIIADIERRMAARREAERKGVEQRWLAGGVSPTEQAYHALLRPAAEGEPAHPDSLGATERRLGELIQARCDRVWDGIRDRRYVKRQDGQISALDGGALFAEFRDIVQEVAALYKPGSTNAVLDARTGDIALAVRSVIGELLQVARQVPFVDPAGWSVREVVTRLEQVQRVRDLYRKLTPYQHYVSGVSMAARLALGANPVTLAAWYLGSEAAVRVAGKALRTYGEAWLKELLESSVALVYLQVARTYDPQRTYRSADWAALTEALRIHRQIPGIDHNRRLLLDRILRAQIPDEFAKLALLRALAADRDPEAGNGPPIDLASLHPRQRRAIADRLAELLPALRGLNEPAASQAIEDLEHRLQRGLQVDLVASGSRAQVRAGEGFTQLAVAAHDWCGLDRDAALEALAGSEFAAEARKLIGDAATLRTVLERSVSVACAGDGSAADAPRLVEPPRDLVGDPLARPLVATLVDLLARRAPAGWPIEHDHMVLLNASVLLPERKQLAAAWRGYLAAVSARLRGLLACPEPSTWPPVSAPAILRRIGIEDGNRPRPGRRAAPPAPAARPPVAVFEPASAAARRRWLLLFADRAVVGQVPQDDLAVDDGDAESHPRATLRFTRRKRFLADDLVVRCGDERLVVAGNPLRSNFAAVLDRLGLRWDALETEP